MSRTTSSHVQDAGHTCALTSPDAIRLLGCDTKDKPMLDISTSHTLQGFDRAMTQLSEYTDILRSLLQGAECSETSAADCKYSEYTDCLQ
jgi:hypothetical protein